MDLIDEEDRTHSEMRPPRLRLIDLRPQLLDSGKDCIERREVALGSICYNPGKGCLSRSRRTVEYHGGKLICLYGTPEEPPLAQYMLLPDILIQGPGPHTCRKRLILLHRGVKEIQNAPPQNMP